MERKESKLELNLESQGWEFLINVNPMQGKIFFPRSDEKIRGEYLKKGFKEVRIEKAYDIHGKLHEELRAIYVKDPDNLKSRITIYL